MSLVLLLIVVLLVCGLGGGYVYRERFGPTGYSLAGILLVVLILAWLFGVLR